MSRGWLVMNRQVVILFCVWLVAERAVADHISSGWNGSNGNWSNAANWTPNTDFPNNGNGGNTYDAAIGEGTVTLDQDIAVQDFYLSGNVVYNRLGTLTATSPYTLTVNGAMTWNNSSTMSGAGQTVIAPTGSLSLVGDFYDHSHQLNQQLVNNGTATWTGLNQLYMNGGTFINNGSFTANVDYSGQLNASVVGTGGTNAFNNYGTFSKLGTGLTWFTTSTSDVPFNNYGTVDIQAGSLRLDTTASTVTSHTGDFTIAAGAALWLGGTHNFASSSDLSGTGTLHLNNATATFDAPNTFAGQLYVENGSAAVFNSNSTIGGVNLISTSSVGLGGTGTVTLTGASDWSNGTMSGTGQTIIAPGATMVIQGGPPYYWYGTANLKRNLVNNGAIQWIGGLSVNLSMLNATLTNNGTFTAFAGAGYGQSSSSAGGTNVFNNVGTFIKQGVGPTNLSIPFNNSGMVDVQTGTLGLFSGGTHTGDFNIASGSLLELSGSHSFAASVDVTGAGTLQVTNGTSSFSSQQFATTTLSIGSGGNANFSGPTTIGHLQMPDNAVLEGTGTVTVIGDCTWYAGTMTGSGQTVIASGASLDLGIGTSARTLSRQLVNNGTTTWPGGFHSTFHMADGTFTNNGSFTVNVGSGNTFYSAGLGGTNVFNNAGTFTKQGDGTAQFYTYSTAVTFNNTGIVDVQGGTLSFQSGVTQHVGSQLTGGVWHIHDGATLDITTGANLTTNFADVTLDGPNSSFAKINSLVDNRGYFAIRQGRDFTAAGSFSNTGRLVEIGAGSTFTAPELTQLVGSTLTAGGWHVGGTLSVTAGANITTNQGDIRLDGPTSIFAQIDSLVDNQGQFSILNGRNFTPVAAFTNSGTLSIGEGSAFNATGGFTQAATGTLGGSGTFQGNLNNPGAIRPGNSPGILTIDGDLTQTATSTLEIEVGGLTAIPPNPLHDKVVVTGGASLDGRLDVPIIDAFVPQLGDSITFLTAANVTGQFASMFSPNLGIANPNVALDVIQNATDVELHFVQPLTNIQFDADTATADWTSSATWDTGVEPDIRNIITVQNLAGVNQRVNVQSDDAYVHQLTVEGDTNTITLGVKNDQSLSAIVGTTVGNQAIIELGDGTTQGNLVSSTVDIESGGLIAGNGTVKTNTLRVSGGALRPGFSVGHLDVDGNYEQSAGGTLLVDVEDGGQRDTIDITGSVQLGGTLRVDTSGITTANPGTTYEIITAGSLSGQFTNVESSGNPNVYYLAQYDYVAGATSLEEHNRGDMNGDTVFDSTDADLFVFGLLNASTSKFFAKCDCGVFPQQGGDFSENGRLDFADIAGFQSQASGLGMGARLLDDAFDRYFQSVPEPSSAVMAIFAWFVATLSTIRRRCDRSGCL